MTPQFKILTGLLASDMNMNIFKGATRKFVKENFETAKKYYAGCWRNFLSTWCLQKAREKRIVENQLAVTEEDIKKVISAMKNGIIKLPPKEWKELKI